MATKLRSLHDYLKYFETLAASYKEIRHNASAPKFFADLETYLMGSGISGKHVIANVIQSRLIDQKSDNVIRPITMELWIVQPCKLNSAEIATAQNDCERVALDWITKIRHDVEQFPTSRTFDFFNTNNISIEFVGPIGNNCFGVSLRVELGSSEPVTNYNSALWD